MNSGKLAVSITTLVACTSLPTFAQSGGAAVGGAGGSTSRTSSSVTGEASTGVPNDGPNGSQNMGQSGTVSSLSAGRAGHAANGLSIGTTGAGRGSPEHPIDSGSR
jgi:hypothetical protein